jgi:hypothetical protein
MGKADEQQVSLPYSTSNSRPDAYLDAGNALEKNSHGAKIA